MKERPILFSGPMVRAILAGTKTQTRRIMKPQPAEGCRWAMNGNGDKALHLAADQALVDAGRGCVPWSARSNDHRLPCPYGAPGDRLWVRERMRVGAVEIHGGKARRVRVDYQADGAASPWLDYPARLAQPKLDKCLTYGGYREASRIDLEIVSVRVERLHDITEADAMAEGISCVPFRPDDGFPICDGYMVGADDGKTPLDTSARGAFERLWESINGERAPWASNPWVWRVEFQRVAP